MARMRTVDGSGNQIMDQTQDNLPGKSPLPGMPNAPGDMNVFKLPMGDPTPDGRGNGDETSNPIGNTSKPGELGGDQMPTTPLGGPSRPLPPGVVGPDIHHEDPETGANGTPSRPDVPTPAVSMRPQPFTPLSPDADTPTGTAPAVSMRPPSQFTGSLGGGGVSVKGVEDGQLGGGLSAIGGMGGNSPDITQLILSLLGKQ